ncbi:MULTISPECIES: C40 family peptidase [Streptomyces]|uniref:C40 family peptidase n=1 Tax=Streptomyces TaxID=1883 RepID=UPI00163B7E54|nr:MULTISPECIES: C40 family peptidase [Streptomyces]MBC2874784.1 C40 family peptidase [Streptomyces sp. TYQ1024]UBI37239.1 C40 family peptidase [Streptomyces mobaraensis]
MASHRKPKHHPLLSGTARKAAGLALAGAATATVPAGTGHAAPQRTPDEVKAQVARYYRQAEVATERYNGVKERTDRARAVLDGLQDDAARRTERLNAARDALGSYATAQYRAGGIPPSVRLLLSSSPRHFLDRASMAERTGAREATEVARVREELRQVRQVRTTAEGKLRELEDERNALARHRRTIEAKLAAARDLLRTLPPAVRPADDGHGDTGAGHPAGRSAPADAAPPPAAAPAGRAPATGRAAQAVAFAYGALGKPYVWGATGPSGYDCSGLTQAAWRAAGVSLPRTTYTQINSGHRVTRSRLAPGDLVFFYSGVSHVGLYVGDGKMIHAPHPGAPVSIAPVDSMPFAGAVRPA